VDFSDIPALIGALVLGPVAGVLIELVKNILDYVMTGSETGVPIGHLANFVAGILFVLPVYYVYNKLKSKKGMTYALIVGSIFMAVFMSLLNYFFFLPAYTWFLDAPAMSGPELRKTIVYAILPFNLVKGILIAIVFMLMFIKLNEWIQKQRAAFE
jgi:riboflavin transporter